ncbi:phosphoribosyltransferase [Agromyces sp. SYSU T00266]|uniref:phosphoribosyltransferase n=1 Tax=Agromyces zhanjiangensis TaxID=3158562 RepID=UPI003392EC40
MFRDRADAAAALLERLEAFRDEDVVVLGLPRGGVPVAAAVAEGLGAPLDVIVVRKLGIPGQSEVAMGAIGEGGVRVVDEAIVRRAHVSDRRFADVERQEQQTLDRRVAQLRGDRAPEPLAGRTALVVDDGLATGATAEAACEVARARGARRVVLAVPVAPKDAASRVPSADALVAVDVPDWFMAVGQAYADFRQTTDEEVVALLDAARARRSRASSPAETSGSPRSGTVPETGSPTE